MIEETLYHQLYRVPVERAPDNAYKVICTTKYDPLRYRLDKHELDSALGSSEHYSGWQKAQGDY
jgi:hypothetical protein